MSVVLPERIETARLSLRAPRAGDASTIFRAYTQDVEVCRFMVWKPHTSEAATRDFVQSCMDAWSAGVRFPYVITRKDADVAVGMIEARPFGSAVDIGYVLERTLWGKGFMPEAIRSLTVAALAESSVFRVQATCDTENLPSQRALEKGGFRREGRLERYTVHPNISSEPRSCFIYAKCR